MIVGNRPEPHIFAANGQFRLARPSPGRRARRMLTRVFALASKETMHIVRDIRTLYFALGMPLIMLVIFGYAVSFDIDRVPTVIVDYDHTPESRELVHHLFSGPTFKHVADLQRDTEAEEAFRRSTARVAFIVPRGYSRKLAQGETATVQVLVDAADNMTATSVLSYASRLATSQNRARMMEATGTTGELIDARVRALFNPDMKSALFLVPGLVALIQAMMAVLLTALTIAREWEGGSMEQLFATPVGRVEIVLGKLLPYFVVGFSQLILILGAGTLLFDLPVRGSIWLVFGISSLFLLAALGQGLLISVATKNQMLATQAAAVSSMLPAALLSGFTMPIDNMPVILQYVTLIIPARYLVHALRAILLRNAPVEAVLPDALALGLFAIATVVISTALFRRRLA